MGEKRRLSDGEREQRRAQDRERLKAAAEQLLTSEGWQRWARVRAQGGLARLSLNNQPLVVLARPDATLVAGFKAWLQGGALEASYVRHLLPRLARRAGLERRVHAHGLRHAYAAGMAREGVPMNIIRDGLGHASLATTDRYLRDVAPRQVIDAMRSRAWVL